MSTLLRPRRQRDWWNTVALGIVSVIVLLWIWLNVCSSGQNSSVNSNNSAGEVSNNPSPFASESSVNASIPASVAEAGEYSESVYDYAKASDWDNVDVKLAALRDVVRKVRNDVNNLSSAVDRLDGNVAALDLAVLTRDRQYAMRQANQVTLDIADITAAYNLRMPVEVTKLDYYGRELEVWVQGQDTNKLKETVLEMRRTWESLRPSVEAHSAAEAKKFDAVVEKAESAKTPADYERVATLVLDEVDDLEMLFP